MGKSRHKCNLVHLSYYMRERNIYDVSQNVYISTDSCSIVLLLNKERYNSDFIAIQRTSDKCFRVAFRAKLKAFRGYKDALQFILETMITYYEQKTAYNNLRSIDNTQNYEILQRLKYSAKPIISDQK